jgi:hypothetical protein
METNFVEKRRSERIDLSINAELTATGRAYKVSIENMSNGGLCVVAPTSETVEDFMPGSTLGVNFITPYGEQLAQNCEIKWLRIDTEPLVGLIYNMGVQMIAPNQTYVDTFNSLK